MIDLENITALHKKYSYPAYLFDLDVLDSRVKQIRQRLGKNARLCYAVKANPFLVRHLARSDKDMLFEACSRGEVELCVADGVNPKRIVFSGVMKTPSDIERALSLGVLTITLESPAQCRLLCDAVKQQCSENVQEVILRLSSNCQFGMCADDVRECIDALCKTEGVRIRGIHYFTGTQKKIAKILKETEFITGFCDMLEKDSGIKIDDIEYGPGLAVDYFSDREADKKDEDYRDLEAFASAVNKSKYTFTVEMGRYIAASCGYYVTRIMDVKRAEALSGGETKGYVIIDGGINHINYYGQMLGMKRPPVVHVKSDSKNTGEAKYGIKAKGEKAHWTVCGSLCTTADIIVRSLMLESPEIGDYLVFSDIGAYSVTEGIYLFLSHALPAVFTSSGTEITERRGMKETWTINNQ